MNPATDAGGSKLRTGDVSRIDAESGGRWVVVVDGHESEMTYSRASPTLITIDHTEVPVAQRSQGIGRLLVTRAVEDARREGFRIVPLCTFVGAQFRRHPDWHDVLSA